MYRRLPAQNRYGWLAIIALLIPHHPVTAQEYCERHHPSTEGLTSGTINSPDAPTVDTLRLLLRRCPTAVWAEVRRRYFGETYTAQLPDWIVYLAPDTVRQAIIQNDRENGDRLLRGEKYVYFEVFVDDTLTPLSADAVPGRVQSAIAPPSSRTDTLIGSVLDALLRPGNLHRLTALRDTLVLLKRPATTPAPDSLRIGADVIQFETPPFLVRLITGFGSKIFGAATTLTSQSQVTDTAVSAELLDLGRGSDGKHLYLAFGKVRSLEDSWGRITILPRPGTHLPGKAYHVLTNYINTTGSRFGLSLGIGATFNAQTTSFTKDTAGLAKQVDLLDTTKIAESQNGQWLGVNLYLLGHWQAVQRKPRPLRRTLLFVPYESLDLVVGTNLTRTSIFDEVVTAVSFTRVLRADNGVTVGVNWLTTQHVDRATRRLSDRRLARFFLGFDFPL